MKTIGNSEKPSTDSSYTHIFFCKGAVEVLRLSAYFKNKGAKYYATKSGLFVVSNAPFEGRKTEGIEQCAIIKLEDSNGLVEERNTFDWLRTALNEALTTIDELRKFPE